MSDDTLRELIKRADPADPASMQALARGMERAQYLQCAEQVLLDVFPEVKDLAEAKGFEVRGRGLQLTTGVPPRGGLSTGSWLMAGLYLRAPRGLWVFIAVPLAAAGDLAAWRRVISEHDEKTKAQRAEAARASAAMVVAARVPPSLMGQAEGLLEQGMPPGLLGGWASQYPENPDDTELADVSKRIEDAGNNMTDLIALRGRASGITMDDIDRRLKRLTEDVLPLIQQQCAMITKLRLTPEQAEAAGARRTFLHDVPRPDAHDNK